MLATEDEFDGWRFDSHGGNFWRNLDNDGYLDFYLGTGYRHTNH